MSHSKQYIFSPKSMMWIILNSLAHHLAQNCVIINSFTVMSLFDTSHPFLQIQSRKNAFHVLTIPSISSSQPLSPFSDYIHFYLNLRRVAIKTFPIEFPVSSCYCPGDCTFLFLLCIFIPYKHNRPSLPIYRNNNET